MTYDEYKAAVMAEVTERTKGLGWSSLDVDHCVGSVRWHFNNDNTPRQAADACIRACTEPHE